MNAGILGLRLLAASDSLRNFEFDWPATSGRWAIAIAAIVALVAVAIGVYRLDSRGLNRGWRVLLTALRLAVIALLVVIAVNPQERLRQMAFRPSRVAILADTSLSMRFPEKSANNSNSPAAQRNRADAVRALLADSPLLAELQKQHNVRIYTFDSGLASPPAVILPAQAEGTARRGPALGRASRGQKRYEGRRFEHGPIEDQIVARRLERNPAAARARDAARRGRDPSGPAVGRTDSFRHRGHFRR